MCEPPTERCGVERLNACDRISLRSAVRSRSYRRLLVVRDPELRFLSAYLDKYSSAAQTNNYNSFAHRMANGATWADVLRLTGEPPSVRLLLSHLPRKADGRIDSDDEASQSPLMRSLLPLLSSSKH